MNNSTKTVRFLPELEAATGKLDYPMTNDYMFRAVLQSNNKALTGLIGSLLHILPEDIASVEVTNPIILGESCEEKEFRLDTNVVLNERRLINLEMQVVRPDDWTSRSLAYLCRDFDSLSRGKEYADVSPVVHIGILDFTLFKDAPEFYSQNMFMNTKTHKIYSDKLILHVLDLNHREYMSEASNSIFRMNADDIIRKRCRDREDYYRDIKRWKKQIREQGATSSSNLYFYPKYYTTA